MKQNPKKASDMRERITSLKRHFAGIFILFLFTSASPRLLWAGPRSSDSPKTSQDSSRKSGLKTTHPKHISTTKSKDTKSTKNTKDTKKASSPTSRGKKSTKEYVLEIEVVLGDGRELKGELPLSAPEKFTVEHIKDGIRYHKEIRLSDIELIEIRRWSGRLLAQKKDGTLYEFVPDRIFVRLKDEYSMIAIGNVFSFIRQFPVYNKNGRVYVFSFWRDLQKKDGTWFTGLKGPILGRRIPHKDVVQRIRFLATRVNTKKTGN